MGSATSLSVETDQPSYTGGEHLTGRVLLRVTQPDKVHANQLELCFEGAENTKVTVQTTTGSGKNKKTVKKVYRSTHLIVRLHCVLAKFDSGLVLQKGDYVFPFSLVLPVGLPAGFSFRGEDSCSIRYTAVAVLSQPGMIWGTSEHKSSPHDIRIEGAHVPTVPVQQILQPRADNIMFLCCFNSGTLHSGGAVSTHLVSNGEKLRVNVAFENHSTSRMKAVEVYLTQVVRFTAQGKVGCHTRRLAYQRLPPEQLGDMFLPLKNLKEEGPNRAMSDDDILRRLTESIVKNTSGSVMLDIADATNSYAGVHITVRHSLTIRVATPFCVDDPEHSCNLFVQAARKGFGGNAYEYPLVQPQALPADWNPRQIAMPVAMAVDMTQGSYSDDTIALCNRAGCVIRRGSDKWSSNYYCGRMLGSQAIPGSDGQCGPNTGPSCLDCQAGPYAAAAGPEVELLAQLSRTFPLAAYGTLIEWFAIHEEITTLSPQSLANVMSHVQDPGTKIRVAAFLSTRLQQISTLHLVAVAKLSYSDQDDSCTGTRWQVVKHLAGKCTDRGNMDALTAALRTNVALVRTLFDFDFSAPAEGKGENRSAEMPSPFSSSS